MKYIEEVLEKIYEFSEMIDKKTKENYPLSCEEMLGRKIYLCGGSYHTMLIRKKGIILVELEYNFIKLSFDILVGSSREEIYNIMKKSFTYYRETMLKDLENFL